MHILSLYKKYKKKKCPEVIQIIEILKKYLLFKAGLSWVQILCVCI